MLLETHIVECEPSCSNVSGKLNQPVLYHIIQGGGRYGNLCVKSEVIVAMLLETHIVECDTLSLGE